MKTRTDWLAFLASAQDGAADRRRRARFQPMLAEGGWKAFDDDGWWFEPKLDGIRCLAELATGETHAAHPHAAATSRRSTPSSTWSTSWSTR